MTDRSLCAAAFPAFLVILCSGDTVWTADRRELRCCSFYLMRDCLTVTPSSAKINASHFVLSERVGTYLTHVQALSVS